MTDSKQHGLSNARIVVILAVIAIMLTAHGTYVVLTIVDQLGPAGRDEGRVGELFDERLERIEELFDERFGVLLDRIQRVESLLGQKEDR